MTAQEPVYPRVHPGALVRAARLSLGWSVALLARQTRLKPGLIESLELGHAGPFTPTIARLLWERICTVAESQP